MKIINNPFDISQDGENTFLDGISYHIRESEQIKQDIQEMLPYIYVEDKDEISLNDATNILDILLAEKKYSADDLTINDERELLENIMESINQ